MLRIKNWEKFQHFKDRNPPWVKLHKSILEQRDITMISDCSFRVLIGLWLLASEDISKQGFLPEIADIAFRLRKSEKEINKALQELSPFIENDDITVISERYQDDDPETETETETYSKETETEGDIARFEDFWALFPRQRRGNRSKAFSAWKSALKRATANTILKGLSSYAVSDEVARGYAKGAAPWLNDDRWANDYKPPKGKKEEYGDMVMRVGAELAQKMGGGYE